jgi:hypothetical protein
MVSTEAKKAHAALDRVAAALDLAAALPVAELTFDERLTLWAELEMVRLALVDATQGCRRAAS